MTRNLGLALCFIHHTDTRPLKDRILYIDCATDSILTFPVKNPLSLYRNANDPSHLFVTTSLPPSILDINVAVPRKAYIQKTYKVNNYDVYEVQDRYVGLGFMAINTNYILHLMQDMTSFNYVLRTYLRTGTFLDLARFDRIFKKDSKANYLIFPNYYLNHVLIRDDNRINVTAFDDYNLVFDATDSLLVYKYKYKTIRVTLEINHPIT